MKKTALAAILPTILLTSYAPVSALSATPNVIQKDSHFYGLALTEIEQEDRYQWVSNFKGDSIIAMTSDSGFTDGVNSLLGASNPTHKLITIDSLTGETKSLGSVNYPLLDGQKFRTLDLVHNPYSSKSGEVNFYVSFSTADKNLKCRKLNVYEYSGSNSSSTQNQILKGQKVFTTPCFPASDTGDYRLHQSGGRISLIPKSKWKSAERPEFYVSVGDFIKLDANSKSLPTNTRKVLGSVIHVKGKTSSVIANGFRNPQGLAQVVIGNKKVLVETEHGPRGGDELNLVEPGKFYGWPTYSYGTAYNPTDTVPANDRPKNEGKSGNSRTPLFAWLPSVAPSQIIQNKGSEFSKWWKSSTAGNYQGDLIMSTLGAQSLFRLRVEAERVTYVEQISVGYRVRSIVQTPRGRLILGTDQGKVVVVSAYKTWDSVSGPFIYK